MPRLSPSTVRRVSAAAFLFAASAGGAAPVVAQVPASGPILVGPVAGSFLDGVMPAPAAPALALPASADATPPLLTGSVIGPTLHRSRSGAVLPASDSAAPPVIEYSDWYARRLTIHQWGSYAMLPLFAAEYALGDRLLSRTSTPAGWVRPTHVAVAYGLGALFTANTVTGVWNAWDARHDPYGRTRRLLHSALMLAADAGFAYTGSLGESARESLDGQQRHRNAALASMGIATVGTAMMWLWRD